jgi:hypothetical protein
MVELIRLAEGDADKEHHWTGRQTVVMNYELDLEIS